MRSAPAALGTDGIVVFGAGRAVPAVMAAIVRTRRGSLSPAGRNPV
ncbi:hypothetical protein SNL152K_7655 [Streptomyces sp. NL15-2K]|nr:hypothetical protein SNL152K_7655 [Streptomyces sp. NL15-2K]